MPLVPSKSPITGKPVPDTYIHTTSCCFVDNHGRSLLLRGVNLSGASKAPVGHLSYLLEDFWESAEAGGESFIGRPLNIDDGSADVHLARLRGWGFNMLRFPFTWEALEHEGPGVYDTEFMDYTIRVLCKCRDYGFRVFMDPHQDTWSRFSGGSGAPYWTLAACGINPRHITATQAAIVHCEYPLAHEPNPANLPAMVWSTNYGRLLSQTIFTLFFAGRTFAPNCIIDNINIQDYLQQHFIEACGKLADRIRAFDDGSLFDSCIIGWDSMNEPFEGLCGWEDLQVNPTAQGSTLKKGTHPTPAQSLRLGMGQAQTVENWTFGVTGPSRNGMVTIDPKGRKIWADSASLSSIREESHESSGMEPIEELPDGTHPRWGWKRDVSKWPLGTCIWAQHGVWDIETGFILRPYYFSTNPHTGEEVEFLSDFWKSHWIAYANRIRRAHEEAIVLVQPPVFAPPPRFEEEELRGRCIYSPHYYDGLTLITRHWNWFNADALGLLRGKYSSTLQAVKIGERAIRNSLHQQLGYLQDDVPALGNGDYPTLIGEIGIPFDMDDKRSYGWTDGGKYKGDYERQEKALDASLNACDARTGDGNGRQSLNWTVWTYVPDDHSHEWGDGWNMEDLSLWSHDDLHYGDTDDEDDMDEAKEAASLMPIGDGRQSKAKLLRGQTARPRKLVKRPPAKTRPMALARASLSFASLGGASLATTSIGLGLGGGFPVMPPPPLPPFPPSRRMRSLDSISTVSMGRRRRGAGWSADPYTFLTNGARAVRAFARPWPVSVVGRAVDVRFDVSSGVFKMRVSVGWEDRIRNSDNAELATEVYVPLVHYAHPRLLEDAERSAEKRRQRRGTNKEREEDGQSMHSTGTESDDSGGDDGRGRGRTLQRDDFQPLSLSIMTTTTTTTTASPTDTTTLAAMSPTSVSDANNKRVFAFPPPNSLAQDLCSPAPLLISDSTPDLVDIIATVSEGRVEVQGQRLFWRYSVPEEGAPRREYTLEVRRRGGVLKPSTGGRKGKAGTEVEAKRGNWCERLCSEDGPCVIA